MAAGGDAKILAVYSGSYYAGKPALIETKCGKGRVLHFGGTFTRENVRVFLKYAGILSPFSEIVSAPEECEIGVRRKDGTDYLFVLNFSKQPQKIALGKAVTDLDSGETAEGEKSLNAYETKVYRI